MQYSPKLKKAMEEIKAIAKKYDVAAFVVLHTPGFSEYLNHLDTSYSCVYATEEGIRVRLKEKEVGKEKAEQLADGSFNMVTHFAEIVGKHALMYMDMQEMLQRKWNGKSFGGEETSHGQQNN